jgi:hypothetical protein
MLPKIDLPTYSIELPISKQQIKFRPYTVKEQKLLMMAVESSSEETLVDTILQVVSNCVVTDINAKELPLTDVEFIFYQLRARSESEIVQLKYKCEKKIDGTSCGNVLRHELNLITDLEISEGLDPTIQITDSIGIQLKHQRFEVDTLKNVKLPTPEQVFEVVANNVDFIFDKESTYPVSDLPVKHVVEFLSQLSTTQYEKIEKFFLNEPKIYKSLQITCNKCGTVHDIKVEDIFDFFI